jgi:hypothetical protein
LPKIVSVLFGPARLIRKVRLNLYFSFRYQLSVMVKDDGTDALGAVIDSEKITWALV